MKNQQVATYQIARARHYLPGSSGSIIAIDVVNDVGRMSRLLEKVC